MLEPRPLIFTLLLWSFSACGGDDSTSASATQTTSAGSTTASTSSSGSGSSGAVGTSAAASSSGSAGSTGSTAADSGTSAASSSGSGSASSTGGACVELNGSCANGELCCDTLMCCVGVPVPEGQEYCGMQCPKSDRNVKREFAAVDPATILARVATLPVTTWSYVDEGDVRHIGPMAQDFRAAFGVGSTDKAIFQVDADGVALAAIQALHAEVEQLRQDKAELGDQLAQLQHRLARLEAGR